MGAVNFATDVDKTVNIDVDVLVDIEKDVFTFVSLSGNLATAEASADAIGGEGGNGPGTPPQFGNFLIDDFDLEQSVSDDGEATDPGGTSDTVVLPNPEDTDIPDVASRTLFIQTLSDGSQSELISNQLGDMELNVDIDDDGFANAYDQYTSSIGSFDPTPLVDNAQILANAADGVPDDFLNVTIESFNPGTSANDEPATARASLVVIDGDGDIAIASVVLESAFVNPITIMSPLFAYLDSDAANAALPPGSPFPGSGGNILNLGANDDVDGDGNVPGGGGADDAEGGVDWDDIESFVFILEDRPGELPATTAEGLPAGLPDGFQTTDFFAFNDAVPEVESVTGTDLALDLIEIETFLPGVPGVGNLAETETFAQTSDLGAFSFSQSVAASSTGFGDFGDLV
ncbi:MAG: hypothetical protein AAFU80_19710 [Pseudomonadota bacterium]